MSSIVYDPNHPICKMNSVTRTRRIYDGNPPVLVEIHHYTCYKDGRFVRSIQAVYPNGKHKQWVQSHYTIPGVKCDFYDEFSKAYPQHAKLLPYIDTICKEDPPKSATTPKKVPVKKTKKESWKQQPRPRYRPEDEDEDEDKKPKPDDWPLPPIFVPEKAPPWQPPTQSDPPPRKPTGGGGGDDPPPPKDPPPAPPECDYDLNPAACPTVPCEGPKDGCLVYHGDRCIHCCDDCWEKKKPVPPYMDEDSSPSEEDRERAWRHFLLEQDLAKLTPAPRIPMALALPDDFIEKKITPRIRPSSPLESDIPENIRDMINAGIELIHPFLTKEKGIEELVPVGPGPRPNPNEIRGGGSAIPPSGYNPHGPVSSTPLFFRHNLTKSINDDPDG